MSSSDARFALTLLEIEGVGRVTAARLLRHFDDFGAIRAFPREQLLHRIKGAPRAAELVERLRDPDVVAEAGERAERRLAAAEQKNVQILIQNREGYPDCLSDLDRADRPVHLYLYGPGALLEGPAVGIVGDAPLSDPAFEAAQDLVDALRDRNAHPVTGLDGGFAKVLQERAAGREAGHPTLVLPACGLGRLPRPLRPVATQALRTGSALCSPFPMDHGPFDHDRKARTRILAALSDVLLFLEPHPETHAEDALRWASGRRELFVWPHPEHPPPQEARTIDDRHQLEELLEVLDARSAAQKAEDPDA